MKILNYEEFVKMPPGTIYSEYEPCHTNGLFRKGDSIQYDDGFIGDFWLEPVIAGCMNGDPPSMQGMIERWATYDYDEMFTVYEEDDLDYMKQLLFG